MFGHGKSKKKWIVAGIGAFCVIGILASNSSDDEIREELEVASAVETETAESTEIFSTVEETETVNLSTEEYTTESEHESTEENTIESEHENTEENTTESETTLKNNVQKQSSSLASKLDNSTPTSVTESSAIEQPSIAQSDTVPAVEQAVNTLSDNTSVVEQPSNSSVSNSGGENNFNTYNNEEQQNTTAQYVLNTHTKKIHFPSCSSVKKISPENYSTSNSSIDELTVLGYTTCGNCFK
jgi:hypothetical protein